MTIWEMLACILASTCLVICLAEGFYIPDELLGRFWPVFIPCAVLNVLAFSLSYSKKTVIFGLCALALAVVAAAVWLYTGTAGDRGLFLAVVAITTLSVFFLSRLRAGAAALLPVGTLIIAGSVLMQYGRHPAYLVIFLISAACLFMCRLYRIAMLQNSTHFSAISIHAADKHFSLYFSNGNSIWSLYHCNKADFSADL